METTVLKVTGMMCDACVSHVTKALENVPGVERALVDLKKAEATVQHNGVDQEALVNAVDEEGYQAEVAPA